jgi:hypothetical protein
MYLSLQVSCKPTATRWSLDPAARLALEEADYRALQQALRTRAANCRADATLAARGPPLRRGSAALHPARCPAWQRVSAAAGDACGTS